MDVPAAATSAEVEALAQSVERAYARIQEWRTKRVDSVLKTPMLRSRHWLEAMKPHSDTVTIAPSVYIKLESEQVTGSFKVRGALNGVLTAMESAAPNVPTIVTASTGNHALAMAHSLSLLAAAGVKLKTGKIFLPTTAKEAKLSMLRTYSDVELEFTDGSDCVVSEVAAGKYSRETSGATYLSPCDNYEVMSGNGTIAAEILNDLRQLKDLGSPAEPATIYVTVGGGGMVSGIGSYLKCRDPGCWRVVGCQPVNSAIMAASVKAGVVVHEESLPTLSDGSAGGLEDGCLPLKFCSVVVDEFILVSEDEIGDALTAFTDKHHKIIEGAAAVAIAAFMKDTGRSSSGPSVIVACGANIDTEVLSGLLKDAAR